MKNNERAEFGISICKEKLMFGELVDRYVTFLRLDGNMAVFLGSDSREYQINEESLRIILSNGIKYGRDVTQKLLALRSIETEEVKK